MAVGVRPVHGRRARRRRAPRERMAASQKLALRGRADRRSRRARLHADAAARAAGAAVSGRAVPAPRARSVRSDRLLAGVAGLLDRQPAGASGTRVRITYAVHGRFTARMERELAEGRRGLGQAALRRLRHRQRARTSCFRGRHRHHGVHGVSRGPDAGGATSRSRWPTAPAPSRLLIYRDVVERCARAAAVARRVLFRRAEHPQRRRHDRRRHRSCRSAACRSRRSGRSCRGPTPLRITCPDRPP